MLKTKLKSVLIFLFIVVLESRKELIGPTGFVKACTLLKILHLRLLTKLLSPISNRNSILVLRITTSLGSLCHLSMYYNVVAVRLMVLSKHEMAYSITEV